MHKRMKTVKMDLLYPYSLVVAFVLENTASEDTIF